MAKQSRYNRQSSEGSFRPRIQLKVMGISYSRLQSSAYALLLGEVDGPYRIPVVIGPAEAQSIAIRMEEITPPRPMTHDLLTSLCEDFGIKLMEVFIHKFEDGIFSSEMTFVDVDGQEVKLDARTSDAIAIAMRTGAPIFTTSQILRETGFLLEPTDDSSKAAPAPSEEETSSAPDVEDVTDENLPTEELQKRLSQAIENERYEEAARLQAIIKSRFSNQ